MRKFFGPMASVSRLTIESQAPQSNMLGDPSERVVDVYIPARHDGQGLPLLVDLVGFTSSGLSQTNWVGFRENLPKRLDRLIGEERMPPVVVAFPDCFTRLGGNQYINSASMGAWEDFLLHEMLPSIEQRFGCGETERRGVFGHSGGMAIIWPPPMSIISVPAPAPSRRQGPGEQDHECQTPEDDGAVVTQRG